jgi:hypothetical protein
MGRESRSVEIGRIRAVSLVSFLHRSIELKLAFHSNQKRAKDYAWNLLTINLGCQMVIYATRLRDTTSSRDEFNGSRDVHTSPQNASAWMRSHITTARTIQYVRGQYTTEVMH